MEAHLRGLGDGGSEALVLACVRPPGAVCLEEVGRLAGTIADWEAVLLLAERCRALPLLARRLSDAGAMGELPHPAARRLLAAALQSEARSRWLLRELERALLACSERGVAPIVLKGAANAAIYGDPGLRPIGDIDLLLRPADVARGCEALSSLGLERIRADETRQITFGQDRPRFYVDVHHTLDLAGRYRMREDNLWAECRMASFGAATAQVFSPTHSLAHAILHTVIHRLESLHPLVDAAWLAERQETVEWDRIAELGRRWKCGEALYYGLSSAKALVGLAPPEGLLETLAPGWWRNAAARRLWPGQDPLVGAASSGRRRARLFSLLAISYPWGLAGIAGRRLAAARSGGAYRVPP